MGNILWFDVVNVKIGGSWMRKDYYHQEHAPTPNSIVPAASAVVVDDEGKILLHKRRDNHLWSLPGGAMELGESIKETIIREVKEETGFVVKVVRCIGIYTDPRHIIAYADGEVRQQFSICFECRIVGGRKLVSPESTEVKFFRKDELDQLDLHPAQRLRLEDYFKNQVTTFIR